MMAGLYVPDRFPSSLPRLQTSTPPGGALPRATFRPECFQRPEMQDALRSPSGAALRLAALSSRTRAVSRIAVGISFQILRFHGKESRDDGRRPLPVAGLGAQLFPAGARQPVKPGFTVVLGGAPLGRDGTFLLELQQHRIERPLVDREKIPADLLDALRNSVAMQGPENIQSLEHHERQRALLNVRFFHISIGFPTGKDDTSHLGKATGSASIGYTWERSPFC